MTANPRELADALEALPLTRLSKHGAEAIRTLLPELRRLAEPQLTRTPRVQTVDEWRREMGRTVLWGVVVPLALVILGAVWGAIA